MFGLLSHGQGQMDEGDRIMTEQRKEYRYVTMDEMVQKGDYRLDLSFYTWKPYSGNDYLLNAAEYGLIVRCINNKSND